MDTNIKSKWLEALRSGRYKQGTGLLKQTKEEAVKHCCLGVLCDIVDPAAWNNNTWKCDGGWMEILNEKTDIEDVDCYRLMNLNDIDKKTFLEIADWIEQKL